MDLENVIQKLKDIENPTEDQKQAIESAEAMTTAPEAEEAPTPTPEEAPVVAEFQSTETTATGDNLFQPYDPGETTVQDIANLAGVPVPPTDTEGGSTD